MGVEKEVKAAGDGKWEYLKGQKMPKDRYLYKVVSRGKKFIDLGKSARVLEDFSICEISPPYESLRFRPG